MPKVLVILHIFYQEQLEWFLKRLGNIVDCEWDLLVTMPEADAELQSRLASFKPGVRFLETENVGYDVWPFLKALKFVDLDAYDYVMKLHTKNFSDRTHHFNGLRFNGFRWRNVLVDALLGSPGRFRRALSLLENGAGMVFSYECLRECSGRLKEEAGQLSEECSRIGLGTLTGEYCAGTMFLVRADLMPIFAKSDIGAFMFDTESSTGSFGTMAHSYERMFGLAVKDAGYGIDTLPSGRFSSAAVAFHKFVSPLSKKIFSVQKWHGKGVLITILGVRMHL